MAPNLGQRNRLAAMQRILATAMNLFDERGYRGVTVDDIAAAAGVSPRTYYRYFGTKEGLFTTDLHAVLQNAGAQPTQARVTARAYLFGATSEPSNNGTSTADENHSAATSGWAPRHC